MLRGLSTPGNSQFAKLLFAALLCWTKELLLIRDCFFILNCFNLAVQYIVCVWKSGLCNRLCRRVLKDHTLIRVLYLVPSRGGRRTGEDGTNYWGPAVRKGTRGQVMLRMFLSFSIVSDVIR
jgi:hypothetical protein